MDDLISRQELLNRTINNPLHPPYITERDVLNCPSAQLESCEDAVFWRKRAEEYENQCIKLAAEIARNSKFDSVELNDKGIKFTMKQAGHKSLT